MVLGLCERFHCLPSALEGESAEILRLVTIHSMGTKQQKGPQDGPEAGMEE